MTCVDVFIYGSCVSRDILNLDTGSTCRLVDYYARCSIISAMSPQPSVQVDVSPIASTFQQRMVARDWSKELLGNLATGDFDILLLDYIDERLPVIETAPGSFVTLSPEFERAGMDVERSFGKQAVIPSGSPRHRELWCDALARFMAFADESGILDRIRLHQAYWSYQFEDGEPLTHIARQSLDRSNAHLDWMYEETRKYLSPRHFWCNPEDVRRSGRTHQWGISPFHYGDDYYRLLLGRISKPDSVISSG